MKYIFGLTLAIIVVLVNVLLWNLPSLFDMMTGVVGVVTAFFLGRYSKRGVVDV